MKYISLITCYSEEQVISMLESPCRKINMTGGTSGAGTAYPYGASEFTPSFQWGSCYSIFGFICMFCRSLFVLLFIKSPKQSLGNLLFLLRFLLRHPERSRVTYCYSTFLFHYNYYYYYYSSTHFCPLYFSEMP